MIAANILLIFYGFGRFYKLNNKYFKEIIEFPIAIHIKNNYKVCIIY